MNHLAHLFLSGEDHKWVVGNFITDFLIPSEQRSMSTPIRQGIQIHLFIDRTIDDDPIYKKSIQLIRHKQGKYAPVVADIYYDYLLYSHWERYSVVPFESFKQDVYRIFLDTLPEVGSEKLKDRIKHMVDRDFLHAYTSWEYMEQTFKMLSKRVHFRHNLDQASEHYKMLLPELVEHFHLVFPAMIKACLLFRLTLQN